jgi:hypothetical protein
VGDVTGHIVTDVTGHNVTDVTGHNVTDHMMSMVNHDDHDA